MHREEGPGQGAASADSKQEAFARRITEVLNHGALNLALAVGYRFDLFEVMQQFTRPQTVQAIAARSRLNVRYLREWLGVMVTGGIVELIKDTDGRNWYRLPEEHAALLTARGDEPGLAAYTQEIPLLTRTALEKVLRAFQSGAGIPYEDYPDFHAYMSATARSGKPEFLIHKFLPSVDFGSMMVHMQEGIRVCDLGCGEGNALLLMAEAFPRSRFYGIDISRPAVAVAEQRAGEKGFKNIELIAADAADFGQLTEYENFFDYITAFDAIHDQTQPLAVLEGVRRMLVQGGLFSMVDVAAHSDLADNQDHPLGPFLYTVSLLHCLPVGLVDGGRGLGMMWGREQAEAMLAEAGFNAVEVHEIPEDPFNLHFLCRK